MDHSALAHLRHEVRTPLNQIIGYSEMLLEDLAAPGEDGMQQGLRRVLECGRRLLAQVNDAFGKMPADSGLAFVVVILPPLAWASRPGRLPWLPQILSVLVAIAGAVWLVQRLLAL